jgi:predicted transcriptional regulator
MPKRWEELEAKLGPERQARIRQRAEQELLDMDLRGLRELAGKTQQEVAALVEQSQSQVSETERRKDMRLSTLRRYVEALGGHLEIAARIGRKRVRLHT